MGSTSRRNGGGQQKRPHWDLNPWPARCEVPTHENNVKEEEGGENKETREGSIRFFGSFFYWFPSLTEWQKLLRGWTVGRRRKTECYTSTWDPTEYQSQHHEPWKATELYDNLYLVFFFFSCVYVCECMSSTSLGGGLTKSPVRFTSKLHSWIRIARQRYLF